MMPEALGCLLSLYGFSSNFHIPYPVGATPAHEDCMRKLRGRLGGVYAT